MAPTQRAAMCTRSSMNHSFVSASPAPTGPSRWVSRKLDALEAHRRMADREGVREGRVVDDRDAGPLVDEEQRRAEIAAVRVRREHVDDEEVGHVAAGREPLLGVHHPAVAHAPRGAGDAAGIGAGGGLGDRVALRALAPQGGLR